MDFNPDYYYHLYNRGVDKRKVFLDKWDYVRFIESLRYFNQSQNIGSLYNFKKSVDKKESDSFKGVGLLNQNNLIDIIAYCLNPNHFHLLAKQRVDNGISRFMQKLSTGYTNYFNEKYHRSGSLFQGRYKTKEVRSTYNLIKVSVYVNCNAEIHGIAKAQNWPWSGYLDYTGNRQGTLCRQELILNEISRQEYIKLSKDLLPDIKAVKNLEKYGWE